MTRKECEDKLLALAEQAKDVYREYAKNGATDLHIVIMSSGTIGIDDRERKNISVLKSGGDVSRTRYWKEVLRG